MDFTGLAPDTCTMSVRTPLALITGALLLTAVGIATLMPPGALPSAPGTDKMQHFTAFAGVSLVITLIRPGWAWAIMLVLIAYGGLIELVQPYVGRTRELADFVADTLGTVAGSVTALAMVWLAARLRGGSDRQEPDILTET